MEEVRFYQLIASLPDHPSVIIPCYAAATDEHSRNSYVLLQDLSETHRPPVTRDQQISLVEGVPAADDIEAVIETLAQVQAAVDELPANQREVITLRDINGWTAAEVCTMLDISEANQRVLLHRARSKVRQALENYLSDR